MIVIITTDHNNKNTDSCNNGNSNEFTSSHAINRAHNSNSNCCACQLVR